METIRIECTGAGTLALHMLTPLQGDLKTLSDENYKRLKFEILEEGFSFPVAVWENPQDAKIYICDGHQRIETLNRMKEEGYIIPQIPVVMVEADSLNQAKRKLLGAASQYGEYNQEGAEKFIQTIQGMDLTELGSKFVMPSIDFSLMNLTEPEGDKIEVSAHLRSTSTPVEGEDDVPELQSTKIQLGDLFQLGRHRLLCGDSTNRVQIERLLNGSKVDLIYTDPPYGINEQTDRVVRSKHGLADGGNYPKIIGDESIETALKVWDLAIDLCNKIIYWGGNYYCHSLPATPCWLVWDKRVEENQRDYNSDCELAYIKHPNKKSVRIFRHLWKGMIKGSEHGERRIHPTQKPVALAEWCFQEMDPDSKNILDFFGGSGSTLIACEKTDRSSFICEMEPQYVQAIIDRWEKFTGQKAVKL